MNPDEFEKLPIIGLNGTVDNDPTSYSELQIALMPYVDTYHSFLWLGYYGVLVTLIMRFIILPLFKDDKKKSKKKGVKA